MDTYRILIHVDVKGENCCDVLDLLRESFIKLDMDPFMIQILNKKEILREENFSE